MNENNNVQNQSNKNVYEELVTCAKELAEKEERKTLAESSKNFSEKQETKEKIPTGVEENSAKELPNLPEEKVLTLEDCTIDELYAEFMKGKAVDFPPWITVENQKAKAVPQELFIYIIENQPILFVKLGNSKGIVPYFYEEGYYKLKLESDCKSYIKNHYPKRLRTPSSWELVFKELQTEHSNIEESELNSDESIINFRNGVLNIDTEELLPHSSKYFSTIQIPCNYIPDARLSQAKVTLKFFNTLTGGNTDDQITILEYIGALISNVYGYRFKKFLVLKGKGNTGKSVLLNLIIHLLGLDNVFNSDIKKLHSNFGLAGAYGKRLICCGDMKFASLSEIDIIKELTGGDYVNLEAKYQNSFTTKFNGLMWFNCNDLPAFSGDKGTHVYERFIILSCDNVISPEQRDPELLEKLKEEVDILVSVAVKFLIKAIKNDYTFTESERTIKNRKKYELENDSLSLFIEKYCIVGEGRTTTKEFKQQYRQWCKENNLQAEKTNSISKVLKEKYDIEVYKSNTQYYSLTVKQF